MMRLLLALCCAAFTSTAQPPSVLVIGDSISIGYTPVVTSLLDGKASVTHNPGNAAHTRNGIAHLDEWLGNGKWNVITFNFGLHDLKIMEDGRHQVELAQYENNLDAIASRLRKTGARLIYLTTTPVPEGKLSPLRRPGDELLFNAAARRVMDNHKIPVVDLHEFALPRLAQIQNRANVHFSKEGSAQLAEVVAKAIEEQLKK